LYRKSTGGIIALGLGVKKLSAKDLIDKFIEFCDSAFTPRALHIYGIQPLAVLQGGSKYQTKPLKKVLENQYGEELLFGGKREEDTHYTTKVAVVSTTDSGRLATVLSNYNRQEVDGDHCKLETLPIAQVL
jgi:hypothetical protein